MMDDRELHTALHGLGQSIDKVREHLFQQDRQITQLTKAVRESGLAAHSAELAEWLERRSSDEAGWHWIRSKLSPITRPGWWLLKILLPAAAGGVCFTLAARLLGG